jgi:hypothetical protein
LVRGKAAAFFATGGVVVYVEDSAEKGCAVRLERMHCVPKKRLVRRSRKNAVPGPKDAPH